MQVVLWLAAHPGLVAGQLRLERVRVALSVPGLVRSFSVPAGPGAGPPRGSCVREGRAGPSRAG